MIRSVKTHYWETRKATVETLGICEKTWYAKSYGKVRKSKFYVREQIFWVMGESERGFGLEFVKNKNKKKIWKKARY